MVAYDGTPEVTAMLARILRCELATIQMWARQLGLDAPAQPEEGNAEAEPFSAPVVSEIVESVAEENGSEKQPFSWTLQRRQTLETALATCTGRAVAERARQISAWYNWPEASVRSKLYEMQRPHRDDKPVISKAEAEQKEEDCSTNPFNQPPLGHIEQESEAKLVAPDLAHGNFVWTVLLAGERHNWALGLSIWYVSVFGIPALHL